MSTYVKQNTRIKLNVAITSLERQLMTSIARDEMNPLNGAEPKSADDVLCYVWADDRAKSLGITEQGIGGLMASLIHKGLIWTTDSGTRDKDTVGFTPAGFEVYRPSQ